MSGLGRGLRRGVTLVGLLLALALRVAVCQVHTTAVQDTVYRADGTAAGGSVVLSWGAFTTANGEAVAAGSRTVTIGTGGVLDVALAPNAGATPMGSYYTAVLHLNDGTTSKEFWVVPVAVPGGGPAKLAGIRNSVLPTSMAMQTVSKQYVDAAISEGLTGFPLASSPYVMKAGDSMTGPLELPADPVSAYQAADKNYVDTSVAALTGGLSGVVRTLPSGSQSVSQPSGTQMGVNLLNGEVYATQYETGTGGNGVVNAEASADCSSGCKVVIEPTYVGNDGANEVVLHAGSVLVDERGGDEATTVVNPLPHSGSLLVAKSVSMTETMTSPQVVALRPGIGMAAEAMTLSVTAPTGGSNQFPEGIEVPPYFKSTYGVLQLNGQYNTPGQHINFQNSLSCYAVGDCLAGSQVITSSGGYRDSADEGAHPFDLVVREDSNVFEGTCATGCATGATNLKVTATFAGGTQGDGRYLIDTNPAKVISTGTIVGGGKSILGVATFTGTSFAASTMLATAQAATSQANNMAPGTVTLAMATTGVPAGFATNTAALPATTGVACIADVTQGSVELPNFEMAQYTVVDGTHLQMTLNKVHNTGAVVSVGGMCGYGLEQTVDSLGNLRQVFPVVGSIDATNLYYADGLTPVVGLVSEQSTSGYVNISIAAAAIARTGNVVSVTATGNIPEVTGLTLTVSGVADTSYNGSYVATRTGPNTLSYANTGPDSTSTGGTLAMVTGGFHLYPMAEVLSVYNPANGQVDGTFTLGANTVAWAAGDTVEEPHFYQQLTNADTEQITQYVPRPLQYQEAGKTYSGRVSAGVRGWQVTNQDPAYEYKGAGGTHNVPDDAYVVQGVWNSDFEVDAGARSVIYAHCNYFGCNSWESTYALFRLDSAVGEDLQFYDPKNSATTWDLRGTLYSFDPNAFTAGTINVGTLNATTITGGVSGAAITSGTVSAARLPVFGPSGTSHAAGVVPDPGATPGATHYLREDGTWSVPAGSGGSPTGAAGGDLTGSYPNPSVQAVHAANGNTLDATGAVLNNMTVQGVGTNPTHFTSNENAAFPNLNAQFFTGAAYQWFLGVWNGSPDFVVWNNAIGGLPSTTYGTPFRVSVAAPDNAFHVTGDGSFATNFVTAPSGTCAVNGTWAFSQDGHATFCAGGTWVAKI